MTSAMQNNVYREILDVLYEYLGPAAERFLDREIKAHLHKKPEAITKSDIPKIHEWSRLAIALLAEDQKTVDDFSKSLLAIAKKHNGTK
jgi:hypothetical protein